MTTFIQTSDLDNLALPEAIRRAVIDVYSTIEQPTASDYQAAHDIVRYMLTGTTPVALLKTANSVQPHQFYQQALELIACLFSQEPQAEPLADTFPTDEELIAFYQEVHPYYEMQELIRVPGKPRRWHVIEQVRRSPYNIHSIISYMSRLQIFETREAALRALAIVSVVHTFCGFAAQEDC